MEKKTHPIRTRRNPWLFVPSLYFAEGIPYVIIMTVSVIMYKRLGLSNTDIAFFTSWLYLPWVIKPLWSPVVDLLRTKRFWIITMQLLLGLGMLGLGSVIPLKNFLLYTLTILWVLAFSSATHDIAADGFYMLSLTQAQQAYFVGIRNTFYRLAMITGQGVLVILAGYLESITGLPTVSARVTASPQAESMRIVRPDSMVVAPQSGDLRIVLSSQDITLSTQLQDKRQIDSLLAMARQWNIAQGFYHAEEGKRGASTTKSSWWQRHVSSPLGRFIQRHFGEERISEPEDSQRAGNIAVVYIHISNAPPHNKSVVVHFGRESGDASINVVEGGRLVFSEQNWNRPAMTVIQLDWRLRTAAIGEFKARAGNVPFSWSITFMVLGVLFIIFFIYHRFILPYPVEDVSRGSKQFIKEFFLTFSSFFKKKGIGPILAFLLLYRFAEAQLVKLVYPFLLDSREAGGLALTTGQLGMVYGTIGIMALLAGGIIGGLVIPKRGLKAWLWWMIAAMNLPDLVFVYLSQFQPENIVLISTFVAIEQFGYGFGFAAYTLYMIYVSEGEHKTAHYAICTGLMALGMMIPGLFSGWLQDLIGYRHFFIWVMIATIPSFVVAYFIPLDPEFGKKKE